MSERCRSLIVYSDMFVSQKYEQDHRSATAASSVCVRHVNQNAACENPIVEEGIGETVLRALMRARQQPPRTPIKPASADAILNKSAMVLRSVRVVQHDLLRR